MARVHPKAETNFQYYRVKHLVHYIDLTPFIRNNTHIITHTHTQIYVHKQRAENEWREFCGKTHTKTSSYQINRLT